MQKCTHKGAVLFQPTLSRAFYPSTKICVTHGDMAHSLGWSIFHSCLLMLWCLGRASAVQVQMAVVTRDRRGHSFAFISDNLLFPTLGVTRGLPSWGGQGEVRAKAFISSYWRNHTLASDPTFGSSWHDWIEERKVHRKETNLLLKRIAFPSSFWVLKPLMGQDLIFLSYTKVSARSCVAIVWTKYLDMGMHLLSLPLLPSRNPLGHPKII